MNASTDTGKTNQYSGGVNFNNRKKTLLDCKFESLIQGWHLFRLF